MTSDYIKRYKPLNELVRNNCLAWSARCWYPCSGDHGGVVVEACKCENHNTCPYAHNFDTHKESDYPQNGFKYLSVGQRVCLIHPGGQLKTWQWEYCIDPTKQTHYNEDKRRCFHTWSNCLFSCSYLKSEGVTEPWLADDCECLPGEEDKSMTTTPGKAFIASRKLGSLKMFKLPDV